MNLVTLHAAGPTPSPALILQKSQSGSVPAVRPGRWASC